MAQRKGSPGPEYGTAHVMDCTFRKKLRLEGYDYSSVGAYFVTVCTAERKPILCRVGADDHIGPNIQLTEIGKIVDKYTRTIPGVDYYVIMPNHVHLIIFIPQDGTVWSPSPTRIDTRIRTWKTLITKELGYSLWQRSYYDHIIRNEQDYIEKAQYILNNPARWCEDQYYSEH